MAYFKVIFQHLVRGTDKIKTKLNDAKLIPRPCLNYKGYTIRLKR